MAGCGHGGGSSGGGFIDLVNTGGKVKNRPRYCVGKNNIDSRRKYKSIRE